MGVFCFKVMALLALLFVADAPARYHQLTPEDFTGAIPANEHFAAYTSCSVNYTYTITQHNGNYHLDFDVRLVLINKQSWMDFNIVNNHALMRLVLRHEQGHYNLAYLMQRDLIKAFNNYHFTANYAKQTTAIFTQIAARYKQLNADYEAQTQHMDNQTEQQRWNAWFERQLQSI